MTASRRAMALAIERREWDRVALCLLLGVSIAARKAPPGTVDDLLALLAGEEPDARDGADGRDRDGRGVDDAR